MVDLDHLSSTDATTSTFRSERTVVAPDEVGLSHRPATSLRLAIPSEGQVRSVLAFFFGGLSIIVYNWWVFVPLKPGLLRSPNELFSDLEVSGQPYSDAMQHADLAAGLLLAVALFAIGAKSIRDANREWALMMVFALAGAAGGIFTESCTDAISNTCRRLEWTFQLPLHHYVHMVAGIVEFGSLTLVVVLAYFRTRAEKTRVATIYRTVLRGAFIAYPILGIAYIFNEWGALIEPVFFVGFSLIVLTQLYERSRAWRRIQA